MSECYITIEIKGSSMCVWVLLAHALGSPAGNILSPKTDASKHGSQKWHTTYISWASTGKQVKTLLHYNTPDHIWFIEPADVI